MVPVAALTEQGKLEIIVAPWIGPEHMNIKNAWHPGVHCHCRDCVKQFP
jgi:hypothetical protein